jgi:ubiquinone/menaquinone biosynthesis C-methylase UbiE
MNRSFAGSMPEFYDRILVPVMFEPFARDLVERLRGMNSGHVLEIATGTGVVTRALARSLPAAVAITATDLNPAMLDQAKSHARMERVRWQEADALALPFGDRLFDYVVCQFGVMFFPDKQAGFREALRVLRAGGRFLFSVWGDREGSVFDVVANVVGEALNRDPASLVAPTYNDITAVKPELSEAGFASITAEEVKKPIHSGSAREAATTMCHGGLIRAAIEAQAPGRLDEITEATAMAIAARFGDGPIESPLRAIVFSAKRPAD